jgi:phosphatidylglycerol---prolipoprotein diacylglyceryl transferase
MYPTMFRIPFLPEWLADIKSYGVMMMIAFLSGIWLACRRAYRSRANPDIVLNMGFIALICGVAGARAMFVIHYWSERFANQPHPILAIFDIRAGGLEFWGGPLLVIPAVAIYVRFIAKTSARWYLDITLPSLAWGLAITRIGCFLNGCCWGSMCVNEHDPAHEKAAIPWAVRFPYGSPAMIQQYKFGELTLPKELIVVSSSGVDSFPLPKEYLDAAVKDGGKTREKVQAQYNSALKAYDELVKSKGDADALKRAQAALDAAKKARQDYASSALGLVDEQCRKYSLTHDQFAQFASYYRSKPVHPAQLYDTINGLLLSWVLTVIFYYRKRHGVVLGWFLILYSISRIFTELIRSDNPLDVFGITISQAISACTLAAGLLWMWIIYTRLPMVSPRVAPYVPPEDEEEPAPTARKLKA